MHPNQPQPEHGPYQQHPTQPVHLPTTPPKKKAPAWAVALGIAILGLCGIGTVAAVVTDNAGSDKPAAEAADNGQFDRDSEQRGEPATEAPAAPEPEPEPETEMTVAQEQAIISAESYLRLGGFSRSGLIDQLEFEGFSEADAEFAVDYLDVDWKEQAVISAESYMDMGGFSRESLIDQLEFEGFTRKQAEHGANEVGL